MNEVLHMVGHTHWDIEKQAVVMSKAVYLEEPNQ